MKTLKISNGEIRLGYSFDDLNEDAKKKVLQEHREFLESIPPYEFTDVDDDTVIDSLDANKYLFDEDGDILPIVYHIGKSNEVTKMVFNNRHTVEFI